MEYYAVISRVAVDGAVLAPRRPVRGGPAGMTAPADVRLGSRTAYVAALGSWAAETMSSPELSWRGPGVYRYGGYMDDGRPVVTLEKMDV